MRLLQLAIKSPSVFLIALVAGNLPLVSIWSLATTLDAVDHYNIAQFQFYTAVGQSGLKEIAAANG